MNRRFFLTCTISIIASNALPLPAFSQTVSKCEEQEEVFSFQILTYPIKHQEGAILNLQVTYRLTPEAIAVNDYPDIVAIKKDIDRFLVNYPNETDYWEIMNKNLVKFILDKYPQMASLKIELGVMPTVAEPFYRSSVVKTTRSNNCDLNL